MYPEDLRAAFPSYGPDWEAAIVYGIDVSLLLENLALTPTERLLKAQRWQEACEQIRGARVFVNDSDR